MTACYFFHPRHRPPKKHAAGFIEPGDNAAMKTHKHLFERVCALENILAASREALRNGRRAKPPDARYFNELEYACGAAAAGTAGGNLPVWRPHLRHRP